MPIKVAIVEDDVVACEGLAFLISDAAGFDCVAHCHTAENALDILPSSGAEVVLMDVDLPGMSGIECIHKLKTEAPAIQIMMLTVFEDPDRIFASLAAGATGYLVKKTATERILQAIRELHDGGSPMSSQIARRVIEAFRTPAIEAENLSSRQRQTLDLLVRGFSYREIASSMDITIATVRTHIRNIYERLHVHSRAQAISKLFPINPGRRRRSIARRIMP